MTGVGDETPAIVRDAIGRIVDYLDGPGHMVIDPQQALPVLIATLLDHLPTNGRCTCGHHVDPDDLPTAWAAHVANEQLDHLKASHP